MRLDLGDITCDKCYSKNLEFCDWNTDERHEEINEIYFMNNVEKLIQDNFSDYPEQEYLFHCKDCNNWFLFETTTESISYSLLPFSQTEKIISNCYLILDPIDLTPKALQINNVYISILSFRHSISIDILNFQNKFGSFYPYPLGTYNLICSVDKSIIDAPSFRLRISNKYGAQVRFEKNIDLEFFKFSIDWYSSEAEGILSHLSKINKTMDEVNLDIDSIVEETMNNNSYLTNSIPKEASINISFIASLLRNQQAYRFLNWLENEIRDFLWSEYKVIYSDIIKSSKWWKGCFPSDVINKIEENQNNDVKVGHKINYYLPLAYADFDNLLTLFEKEWDTINLQLKKDFDVIKGHFKYMKHFRNTLAHSRYLSHDDIIELQENAHKFLLMIGIKKFDKDSVIFYKNIGNAL